MRKPKRFNLLIVHGDGTRVLRLNLPRWVLYGGLTVLALAVSTLGAIYGDYISLKRQFSQVAGLQQQVVEQRALIDSFQGRIAEVRSEVSTWGGLHAKIWEPFGPEAGPARKGTGIGGGVPVRPALPGNRVALSQELDLLTATVNEEGQSLRALERFMVKAGRVLAALPSRWPVRGAVNSEYGRRLSPWTGVPEFHSGIDISSERGTSVKAPAPGTIIFAGSQGDYGNTVILDHGNDIRSLYGHLQKIQVTKGQQVQRGQVIALSGNTGKTSGPHLHYEILVKGQAVNPRGYLWD
ncbi:MAG: M23 family metallopeptidase [Candidatus Rokubacteria bacterium]|nr:M23 family metallopeptidase [Candidatus Rokubacteria bacterium]